MEEVLFILQQNLENANGELERLRNEIDKKEEQLQGLESNTRESTECIERLTNDLVQLDANVNDAKQEYQKVSKRLYHLKNECLEHETAQETIPGIAFSICTKTLKNTQRIRNEVENLIVQAHRHDFWTEQTDRLLKAIDDEKIAFTIQRDGRKKKNEEENAHITRQITEAEMELAFLQDEIKELEAIVPRKDDSSFTNTVTPDNRQKTSDQRNSVLRQQRREEHYPHITEGTSTAISRNNYQRDHGPQPVSFASAAHQSDSSNIRNCERSGGNITTPLHSSFSSSSAPATTDDGEMRSERPARWIKQFEQFREDDSGYEIEYTTKTTHTEEVFVTPSFGQVYATSKIFGNSDNNTISENVPWFRHLKRRKVITASSSSLNPIPEEHVKLLPSFADYTSEAEGVGRNSDRHFSPPHPPATATTGYPYQSEGMYGYGSGPPTSRQDSRRYHTVTTALVPAPRQQQQQQHVHVAHSGSSTAGGASDRRDGGAAVAAPFRSALQLMKDSGYGADIQFNY